MGIYSILGKVVLNDGIINDGMVVIDGGVILYAGQRIENLASKYISKDMCGKIIGPGFVDIHCHAGRQFDETDEPLAETVEFLTREGCTAMLCTLYRSLGHKKTMEAIERQIKPVMKSHPSLLGVHMEGPYLNPAKGALRISVAPKVNEEEYREIINTGTVVQWTYAPEIEGTDDFLRDIIKAKIIPAIGHSKATCAQAQDACKSGARIVTHMFNAMGDDSQPIKGGITNMSFDRALMLADDMFYEIICDKDAYHVAPDLIRLLIKTVGIDGVVAITDYNQRPDGSDVCLIEENGKKVLCGSAMTMRNAAANLAAMGLSIPDVFRLTSLNPSRAIGVQSRMGSLEPGKQANLVISDEKFEAVLTILNGELVS